MAYAGSTEGSSIANPPLLVSSILAGSTAGQGESTSGSAWKQWVYRSTHLNTAVDADGFITDAQTLGMQLGDSVISMGVLSTALFVVSHHSVRVISSTGATLSDALLISSAS